jgi:hypothetical protein
MMKIQVSTFPKSLGDLRGSFAVSVACALLVVACTDPQNGDSASEESAGEESQVLEVTEILAHFVVQTRATSDPVVLEERVRARYGTQATVERLFEDIDPADDPDGMARMFRVSVPQTALQSQNLWDSAYALEEELDLTEAEPDLEPMQDEALETGQLCFVEEEAPIDKEWSVKSVAAVEAWGLTPPGAGQRFGEGISICHPDTGWSEHVELDASRLDLTRAKNLLAEGPADARDPLDYSGGMLNPGHGTGTGTVIVSEHEQGEIKGMAPKATLVPIRTAKSVIQVFDSDLARAVNHAVDAGCDVISMSLGGRAFFGLKAAIKRAVRNDVIVAAAAGNCVRFVVAPAAYDQCLAIAATNIANKPWIGSSRGGAVDVSAPGEHVWTAKRREASAPTDELTPGQGTSYAVANVAGAAALWLAYRDLADPVPGTLGAPLQEVFREVLRRTAQAPAEWNPDRYGAGILNVKALLEADLAPPESFPEPTESAAEDLELLAAIVDRTPQELGPLVANLFDVPLVAVEDELRQWGPELIQQALADPRAFERLLGTLGGEETGATPVDLLPGASNLLQREIE